MTSLIVVDSREAVLRESGDSDPVQSENLCGGWQDLRGGEAQPGVRDDGVHDPGNLSARVLTLDSLRRDCINRFAKARVRVPGLRAGFVAFLLDRPRCLISPVPSGARMVFPET